MREDGEEGDPGKEASYRLKIYATLIAILVAAALLSFLIVPQGGGAGECKAFLLENSRYACLASLAVSSLNATVCGSLPVQYADPCYSQVALRAHESSACLSVTNSTAGYACTEAVALATGNYSLCTGIGEPYAGACARGIAVRLGDPSLCGITGNATSSAECSSIIYITRMLRSGDAGYCANVTSAANESVANYVIANITYLSGSQFANATASLAALAFMPNLTYGARDFCYSLAAEKLDNATLCAKIGDSAAADLCSSQLATTVTESATSNYTQLISACSELGSESQTCVQSARMAQAIATRNATECGSLGYLSDGCYSSLATTYNDLGYCTQIVNESVRAACLSGT